MERAGFRVEYAVLFDRPTEQKTGDGLADWVRMFVKKPFEGLEPALGDEILRAPVCGAHGDVVRRGEPKQ